MIRTGDVNVDRAIRAVVKATDKARADQHAKGKRLTVSTSGAGGDQIVNHGLGYKPDHVVKTASRGSTGLQPNFHVGDRDSRRVTLTFTSGTASLDLWIY